MEAGAALCCFSSDTAVSVPEASRETTFPHISTFWPIYHILELFLVTWALITCWHTGKTLEHISFIRNESFGHEKAAPCGSADLESLEWEHVSPFRRLARRQGVGTLKHRLPKHLRHYCWRAEKFFDIWKIFGACLILNRAEAIYLCVCDIRQQASDKYLTARLSKIFDNISNDSLAWKHLLNFDKTGFGLELVRTRQPVKV